MFSRMLRRRVPVLRLGSKGPGGDARLLRLWTQASAIVRNRSHLSASVRNRSQRVGHARGTKIVAKRRTVVTFGLVLRLRVSNVSTVTGIRGGPGRETHNCPHFWTRPESSRIKSVNSHRDRGSPGRETQNCQHFWKQSRGSGGPWSRNAELSSLLDSSRVLASQKCQQSRGGSRSRNAKLSSLLDSSCVFASQKCQESQGSGGVLVAKRRTVVTFGLVLRLRILKLSTITGIGGVLVAKRRIIVTVGLAPLERGKERGERRKER